MTVKMAAVFIVSVLLTCCCFVSCTGPSCDLFALKGSKYTVPLGIKLDASKRLKWTLNDGIIFKQKGETIITGKKEDISANGSLVLMNVGKNQEGVYAAEVHNTDGASVGTFIPVRLCVQDSVKQPKVTMKCKLPDVIFTCSDKGEDGKVVWSQDGKAMKETGVSVTLKAEKVQTGKFTCQVSNKVSTSASVPVTQDCYKPGITLPEEILGINTWVIIGAGAGIALLLLIIVIVCCIRAKRRKRMHIKDEEELRLGWTNPNQQQQHHHHHHHPPNQRRQHQHHHEHQQHQHQHQQQHQHQHRQQPAGHTGPRPHRPKQQRHKKQPDQYSSQPQPSPRRPAQAPRPADEEKPPPLPQPRKKAPKPPHM